MITLKLNSVIPIVVNWNFSRFFLDIFLSVDLINAVELVAVVFSRQHVNVILLLQPTVESIALERELSIDHAISTIALQTHPISVSNNVLK